VEWNEVDNYKHIDVNIDFSAYDKTTNVTPAGESPERTWSIKEIRINDESDDGRSKGSGLNEIILSGDEIDSIINRTYFANKKAEYRNPFRKHKSSADAKNTDGTSQGRTSVVKTANKKPEYLLVDGYNIIFAWDELKELAASNLDAARDRLNDILTNYRAVKNCEIIAVYDAYRVAGHPTEYLKLGNINIVFTKEAETADRFIERFAHENASKYDVTVATSDGLEQIIIRGQGAKLLSARDFKEEVDRTEHKIRENLTRNSDHFSLKHTMNTKITDLF
jgi:predicted RNA-binding protein with PIN domain